MMIQMLPWKIYGKNCREPIDLLVPRGQERLGRGSNSGGGGAITEKFNNRCNKRADSLGQPSCFAGLARLFDIFQADGVWCLAMIAFLLSDDIERQACQIRHVDGHLL